MKGAFKWIGIVVGVLVIVVIATLLIIPHFIDIEKYKPVLESKVTEATGRPFSVGGDLSLSLFPWAGVSFSDLQLGNPKGFAEKEFVSVNSFDVRVKLLPLLSRDIQIKRFIVHEPKIVLVKSKNGRVNWSQPKKAAPKAKEKKEPAPDMDLPIQALTVGDFTIKNGSALWIDHAGGTRQEVTDINLTLSDVSLEKPIKFSLSAQLDSKPFSVGGTAGPVGRSIGQQPIALDLTIKALKELNMTLKGQVENPLANPNARLTISLSEFSPRRLMKALGADLPVQTADPKALSRVALKADVTAGTRAVTVSNGDLVLDDTKGVFSMKASEFARPNLAFDMNLDQIDLNRYLPPKSQEKAEAKKKEGASEPAEKPDYEPLRKMILDGTVKIGTLSVDKAKLNQLLLRIRAKNGVIRLDPLKMNLYDGTFAAKSVVNLRTNTPVTDLSLNVEGVQVNPILQDFMEKDILEGTTRAQISLRMKGDEAAAIKRTLTGRGRLSFNDGAIVGIDLAAMARNTKAAFGLAGQGAERPRTDFTELNVPFSIKKGLFNTPGSELKSPFLRLLATGNAHLVNETLDFRVEPKVVATIKGQGDAKGRSGLQVPVLITGSFSQPKFRADLEALAKSALEIDKKTLESTGKQLLDAKAKEMMGDSDQGKDAGQQTDQKSAGEKPEDTAKRLLKGLFKSD